MTLNLAYISLMLAPFDEGGPGTVAYHILKEFVDMPDIAVTLIVGDSPSEEDIIDVYGDRFQKIVRIPRGRTSHNYANLLTGKAKEVWKALDGVDIVHINNIWILRNFYFPLFSSLRLKPTVFTWHGTSQEVFYGEKGQMAKYVAYYSTFSIHKRLWSKVIVNSEFMRTLVSRYYNAKRICLIRNGVQIDQIRKAKKVQLEGEVKLLFVGKLISLKGVDLLLKAFSDLKNSTSTDIRLYIAGTGTHEPMYKSLASQLGVEKQVHFLGHLPLSECYSLYRSCSMLVLPSRFESAPMTLLEGLAAGIPIVATNVGGIPEIVEDGRNGFLTRPDSSEIAEKIRFLIAHPEDCERISRNNLEDAGKYSWRNIALAHIDLYKSLA
jgi:glycosyltransferase involved in cell wall biosynthesis